jgi:hypothetical protein
MSSVSVYGYQSFFRNSRMIRFFIIPLFVMACAGCSKTTSVPLASNSSIKTQVNSQNTSGIAVNTLQQEAQELYWLISKHTYYAATAFEKDPAAHQAYLQFHIGTVFSRYNAIAQKTNNQNWLTKFSPQLAKYYLELAQKGELEATAKFFNFLKEALKSFN